MNTFRYEQTAKQIANIRKRNANIRKRIANIRLTAEGEGEENI